MKRKALLLSQVDIEDYWVTAGIAFPVANTELIQAAFEEILPQLKENVDMVRKTCDNELGEFIDVTCIYDTVKFEFENGDVKFQTDFVTIFN